MSGRELPEIRYASKGKLMEKELRKTATEQDRKSNVRKRQIDRNIYLTTKELNDIQTHTPSPTRAHMAPGNPLITVSDVDNHHHHHHHQYDNHHSPRSLNNNNNEESDFDPHLVHLSVRTRRNLLLSQKLSRSLEKADEKRVQGARPPPSACKERGAYRAVSSRSMEDLQRAAAVLRYTEYEDEVQQLLSSVSVKEHPDHHHA